MLVSAADQFLSRLLVKGMLHFSLFPGGVWLWIFPQKYSQIVLKIRLQQKSKSAPIKDENPQNSNYSYHIHTEYD